LNLSQTQEKFAEQLGIIRATVSTA